MTKKHFIDDNGNYNFPIDYPTAKQKKCINCNHISGVHNPSIPNWKCRYVHFIEGVGASVCKCSFYFLIIKN